ncbi:MAG: Alcohol dehydrogenase GroES domain protein [Acidimicrobiia bacterium]|nr:Alcohol dehydrogenase GroES domain protein [Acidimicrobiia bacterium]
MKGAVYYGPRDIRIESVADPVAEAGQVLVEVARNGICGSDLHTYVGSDTGGASMHVPGVVLGHEFSGIVRAVGAGVDDIAIGTAVAVAPIEFCDECWACRHGWPNMCRKLALYGGYRRPLHGGLAPFVAVSRRSVFPVPAGLDVVTAALTEPVAVAVHAVRRAPQTFGASVMVLGAGPIGLAVLQSVVAAGARFVIVSEMSAARRAAALRFGATVVLDPSVDNVRHAVRDLSPHGLDLVFDTTAAHSALNSGIAALRPRGTLVSVAGWQEQARVDMGVAMAKEIDVVFSMTYQPSIDFPLALHLLASGGLDGPGMISDHIGLDQLVDQGLEELLHHADHHIKILVEPV